MGLTINVITIDYWNVYLNDCDLIDTKSIVPRNKIVHIRVVNKGL